MLHIIDCKICNAHYTPYIVVQIHWEMGGGRVVTTAGKRNTLTFFPVEASTNEIIYPIWVENSNAIKNLCCHVIEK